METVNKICIAVVIAVVVFIAGYTAGHRIGKTEEITYTVVDTTYDTTVLDSIEYRIIRKDSVIYNLKKEMRDEVVKSFELGDSAAVRLFGELATGNP